MRRVTVTTAALAVGLLRPGLHAVPVSPQAGTVQAFTAAHLVTDVTAPPIDDGVVVVEAGRIVAAGSDRQVRIPAGSEVTALGDRTILPGLVSAHVHVSDIDGLTARAYTLENTLRQLRLFARYGVTSVFSLGGEQAPAFEARDAQDEPTLDRARIHVAGPVVTATTPEAARDAVAALAADGVDIVKIRVDDNLGTTAKMTPDVYQAVIAAAHARNLRVAAHIFYLEDAKALLRAGVDMIAHSVRDTDIDNEFVALMRARDVPYCPTLTRELASFVYESTPGFFSDPLFLREADPAVVARLREPGRQAAMRASTSAQRYKAGLAVAIRNLKRASDAGLRVVMGTDAGALPERFQGYFEHLELSMMADAGLTPVQVLRAATVDAARALGTDEVGTLRPGAWADFGVYTRDPLADIDNVRSLESVWIAGNRVPDR